jgi:hypothetical protein
VKINANLKKRGQVEIYSSHNESGPCDIVLANDRMIDPETYLDGRMRVGIQGDRIAAESEQPLEGKETVSAKGHVMAPVLLISITPCSLIV